MCKVINFNEYRGNKKTQERKQITKKTVTDRKLRVQELVTKEWLGEYMQKGWGLSKLVFRIIEQYGYIRCRDGKKYVFEEIRRDVKYHEMYPEVENKRLKAPLWVKVSGEWYFVELCTDTASGNAFINKLAELGNYGVKGFRVDLYGLKTQELKRMLESNDLKEAIGKINDFYYDNKWIEKTSSTCRASVTFGSEKNRRDCPVWSCSQGRPRPAGMCGEMKSQARSRTLGQSVPKWPGLEKLWIRYWSRPTPAVAGIGRSDEKAPPPCASPCDGIRGGAGPHSRTHGRGGHPQYGGLYAENGPQRLCAPC